MSVTDEQQFCLRWNNFQAYITSQFETLRDDEDFVDVTLACEGQRLGAHKVVLSACSPFFKELFKTNPCPHPIIFMRDVEARHVIALLEFMYAGEVNVAQAHLAGFLRTAESLQIRGLTDASKSHKDNTEQSYTESQPTSTQFTQNTSTSQPSPGRGNPQKTKTKPHNSPSRAVTSTQERTNEELSPPPCKKPCSKTEMESERLEPMDSMDQTEENAYNSQINPFALQTNKALHSEIDISTDLIEPKLELPDYSEEDTNHENSHSFFDATDVKNTFTNLSGGMEIIPGTSTMADASQESQQEKTSNRDTFDEEQSLLVSNKSETDLLAPQKNSTDIIPDFAIPSTSKTKNVVPKCAFTRFGTVTETLQRQKQGKSLILAMNTCFNEQNRRALTRIVVDELVQVHGNYYPPTEAKIALARAIVSEFPRLKNNLTEKGYEHYFNENTRHGFLEFRLWTMRRDLIPTEKKYKVSRITTQNLQETTTVDEITMTEEEFEEKLSYMKNLNPIATNKSDIKKCLADTFKHRRKWIRQKNPTTLEIFDKYPRLKDFDGEMIDCEFKLQHFGKGDNFIEKFPQFYVPKVLAYIKRYKGQLYNNLQIYSDENTKALIGLVQLLLTNNANRKKTKLGGRKKKSKQVENDTTRQSAEQEIRPGEANYLNIYEVDNSLLKIVDESSNFPLCLKESLANIKNKPYIIGVKNQNCLSFFVQGDAWDTRKLHSLDPRPCPVCGRVYSNLSNLRQHMRLIHNPTHVECPVCSKSFKTTLYLKRHLVGCRNSHHTSAGATLNGTNNKNQNQTDLLQRICYNQDSSNLNDNLNTSYEIQDEIVNDNIIA